MKFVRLPSRRPPWVRYVVLAAIALCWMPSHFHLDVEIADTRTLDCIIWFCILTFAGLLLGEVCWRVVDDHPEGNLLPMQRPRPF